MASVGPLTDTQNGFAPTPLPVLDENDQPLPKASKLGAGSFIYTTGPSPRVAIINGTIYRWGGDFQPPIYRATRLAANMNGDPVTNVASYFGTFGGGFIILANGTLLSHGTTANGFNDSGQLGIGTTDSDAHPFPTPVLGLGGLTAKKVTSGGGTACALLSSDEVVCWGSNLGGAAGVGTSAGNVLQPANHVQVSAGVVLTGITDISHALGPCALRGSDGSVWCWGRRSASAADVPYATRIRKASDGTPLLGVTKLNPYHLVDERGRVWSHNGDTAQLLSPQPSCP
jgi:hypothetical protein